MQLLENVGVYIGILEPDFGEDLGFGAFAWSTFVKKLTLQFLNWTVILHLPCEGFTFRSRFCKNEFYSLFSLFSLVLLFGQLFLMVPMHVHRHLVSFCNSNASK